MNFGKRKIISNPIDIAEEYRKLAQDDLRAATTLEKNGLYNQAGYYYFQSMEKKIKYHVAKKINIIHDFYAEEIRRTIGHSLNKSVDLLLEIYSGKDQIKRDQLKSMLDNYVFRNKCRRKNRNCGKDWKWKK